MAKTEWLDTVVDFYEALYHDLKTPMAILFAYVQRLERMEGMPDSAGDCLSEIKRNSFRMAKLVRDANDRARMDHGLLKPRYVNTDAVALLRRICEDAQTLTRRRGIRVVFESPLPSLYMAMDKQLWERIALNLLSNAKDFSREGGEIRVTLREKDGTAIMSVRDYGKGVAPENVSRVFTRGFGETSRGVRSGLGLYIVKELVELMRGETELIRTEPGTEVIVRAPVFLTEDTPEIFTADDFFSDNMVQMELSGI